MRMTTLAVESLKLLWGDDDVAREDVMIDK